AHYPMWRIHDLTDFEIHCHAAEHVRLAALQAMRLLQMGDHVANGLTRRLPEIRPNSLTGVVGSCIRPCGDWASREKLWLGGSEIVADRQAHSGLHWRFNCRPADLTIPLRGMAIAHRE